MIGIYIGAPIDTALGDVSAPFQKIISILDATLARYVVFNPLTTYNNATKANLVSGSYLVDVNMYALERAELAVFLVNDSPSVGLPIEIYKSKKDNKKFIVLYDASRDPGVYLKNLTDGENGVLIDLREGDQIPKLEEIFRQWRFR